MALIKCPECRKEISDKAATCPNCGCPTNESPNNAQTPPLTNTSSPTVARKKKGHGCLFCIITFFALSAFVGFWASKDSSTVKNDNVIEFTKEDAADIDDKVWENVEIAIKANNVIVNNFDKALSGEISLVDYYDSCKEASKVLGGNSTKFPKSDNDGAKSYIQSSTQYVIQVQILSDSVIKYIDKAETKNLSAVKSNIEQCSELIAVVAQNRGVFLSTNGFTDEEIKERAEQISVE